MKQKLAIILVLGLVIAVLVALNAATYVQREKVPDTEFAPNRSTYNSGSTGTHAFYSLLAETGRNVTQWRTSLEGINLDAANAPVVFVMIGPFRNELTDAENTALMNWVADGGTLVLIDREPSSRLALSTSQWQISVSHFLTNELFLVDASDQKQMTASMPAHKPVQPSYLSRGVYAVQPSRFASSISLGRFKDTSTEKGYGIGSDSGGFTAQPGPPPPPKPVPTPFDLYSSGQPSPSPPDESDTTVTDDSEEDEIEDIPPGFEAPLVHVAGSGRNLVAEAPFVNGRVIILADPYVTSNAGINLVDNARLGVNIVTSREGLIAFDEYHHGYGSSNNRLIEYFTGTPVIAIFLQVGLIIALVFFSQSRRFARPVLEKQQSRLSKLEYVSAMAELQQRTRAYDLALENIYTDFRRRVCGLVGLDNTLAKTREIAARVSERTGQSHSEIIELFSECEDIIHGDSTDRKQTVGLVERIRNLEKALGLKRVGRAGM